MSRPPMSRPLVLMLVAVAWFAACGGGDGSSATPTTGEAAETADDTDVDESAVDPAGEEDEGSDLEGSAVDPAGEEDEGSDLEVIAEVDAEVESCLGGDRDACYDLGVLGASVPPTIQPDSSQERATADEILTECYGFGIVSACYEAGVRNLDPEDTPSGGADDGFPDGNIGERLADSCLFGDPDACVELGERKFPPPASFTGQFDDAPDLTVQSECFDVGVQEACYEAGLRGISASTVIGE